MSNRLIKTEYYLNGRLVHTNSATDANRAVGRCVEYMQIDYYGADVAQVYDAETAELHVELKWHKEGDLRIKYKRDPKKYARRLAPQAIIAAVVKGRQ